ncbi:TPA: PqqD family protein [bacterium]|nr:MAG: PqqD family protein [Candidatus Hydrogenedentes bacterium CG07_land_8_20_14_0_80_42_17]HBW47017.1 PqqD family protein [bacterium]
MTSLYSINPDLAWRVIDNEVVILKIKTTTYYSLDPIGTFIWKRMEKTPKTREEILKSILEEFEVENTTASNDLDELIADLVREELILESAA